MLLFSKAIIRCTLCGTQMKLSAESLEGYATNHWHMTAHNSFIVKMVARVDTEPEQTNVEEKRHGDNEIEL